MIILFSLPSLASFSPFSPSLSSCFFDIAKYLSNAYYVPDTLPGTGDSAANEKNKKSCLYGVYILVGEMDKKINK